MWLGLTILPCIFAILMSFILMVVQGVFWTMQHTRLPIWARRKFSKRLRPPRLLVATDSDALGDRVTKKLFNLSVLLEQDTVSEDVSYPKFAACC